MDFDQLIRFAVEQGASDVHLQSGAAPLLRINGQIRTVDAPPVAGPDLRQFILSIKHGMTPEALGQAMYEGLDFSYAIPGVSRFRCNVYSHMGNPALVMRIIGLTIRTMDDLKLPEVLKTITLSLRGLTLLTGTTGSGKSTTLAAMVDLINRTYRCKIITIEDPVEYMHSNQKSMIAHLELGQDTPSFEQGLRRPSGKTPTSSWWASCVTARACAWRCAPLTPATRSSRPCTARIRPRRSSESWRWSPRRNEQSPLPNWQARSRQSSPSAWLLLSTEAAAGPRWKSSAVGR